jgi:hypothetical protein
MIAGDGGKGSGRRPESKGSYSDGYDRWMKNRQKKPFTVRYAPVDPQRIIQRLCANPNYNNDHVELNNWCLLPLREVRKPKLQEALNESIAKDGMRNPIIVWSLPEGLLLEFGGTRLRAAQHLELDAIPAIVIDYTEEFSKWPEVTPENWMTFFKDVPKTFEFTEHGIETHYSIERMRRHKFDPAGMAWLKGERPEWIEEELSWLPETIDYK